ncbi:serine/threonine protein kinase [Peribacillus saganii]|uniref:Serine/threonine protein kinase n=1 Tax=Peribacillus saganii TaxID=2303992 RepID=A0A372LEC3_9BACI|nr:serine/threonine protein kinase [Peribacillus saganii]RFU64648.1 serine/threonine protein kinase [Peribacillus saganii]
MSNKISDFKNLIEQELLYKVQLTSEHDFEPIKVDNVPKQWKCMGAGNYAAVFLHSDYQEWVVKVYGRNVRGLKKEVSVYQQLGSHPAYSELMGYGDKYVILKRLKGITLYDAVHKGKRIPPSVIKDINKALDYARTQGLNPYDVHGKNVMMKDGRGYVVDISDFYKEGSDKKWGDLVTAYYKVYKHTLYKFPIKIPFFILDLVRYGYRIYKSLKEQVRKK